jgi:hypothetical protein
LPSGRVSALGTYKGTIGGILPLSGASTLGRTIVFNTALDYRIKGIMWPMLEQNSTLLGGRYVGWKEVGLPRPWACRGQFLVGGKTPLRGWLLWY